MSEKVRDNTSPLDRALGVAAVDAALSEPTKGSTSKQAVSEKSDRRPYPQATLTADRMGAALQGISIKSCDEIDALVADLNSLREKLVLDGERIAEGILEFATFSQSVRKLTEVVSDGIDRVKKHRPSSEE